MRKKLLLAGLVFSLLFLSGCCLGGHEWQEATCTEPKTCTKCGETEGEALGHEWTEATCTEPKTCSKCGETEGEALGHEWQEATCTEPKTCSVCGETEGEALGHEWSKATCTEPKTCSVCGETEGEALGHKWTEATCTEPKTCSVCGETEGEALGHKAEAATCTEDSVCSVCGEILETAHGHSWQDATAEKPKTCEVCGLTEGEPIPTPTPVPTVQPTPTPDSKKSKSECLTIENDEAFAQIMKITNQTDTATIKKFANSHIGQTIEFDGCVALMMNHVDYFGKVYKTRFDVCLVGGDYTASKVYGPLFAFEDVNFYDMNVSGADTVAEKMNFTIRAKILGFDSEGNYITLEPVSMKAR